MDSDRKREIDADVRRRIENDDVDGATSVALRAYGPEIFEFVAALHRNDSDASEVFSIFAEKFWRNLKSFRWDASLRTWAYTVARNVSHDYRRAEKRRVARIVPLLDASMLSAIEAEVRTVTQSYLRSETRDRFAQLRAQLSAEEQELLMLRVDRQLSWDDLAVVLQGDGNPMLSVEEKKRAAARLRKRFQHVKEKLYEMGRREGLVGQDD